MALYLTDLFCNFQNAVLRFYVMAVVSQFRDGETLCRRNTLFLMQYPGPSSHISLHQYQYELENVLRNMISTHGKVTTGTLEPCFLKQRLQLTLSET